MTLIDLSSNNSPKNFRQVKAAGVIGGWVKVGGGGETHAESLYLHSNFHPWADRMRAAGLRVGGYWFAVPTTMDAKRQAAEFAKALGKIERRDLRPVLDYEKNLYRLSQSQLEAWAHAFCQEVKRLTGVGPLYYSYASYLRPAKPIGYGYWLANYSDSNPAAPAPWKSLVAHQYTSRGHVNGINGFVDLSRRKSKTIRPLLAHPVLGLL